MSDDLMTPAALEKLLADQFPDAHQFDVSVERVDATSITLRQRPGLSHLRPGGTLSGPALITLADTAAYLLLIAKTGPETEAVTTSIHMDFLRRPEATDLLAHGKLLRRGRRLAACCVELYSDNDDRMVGHASVTYALPNG